MALSKVTLENKITLGNIITVAVFLFTAGVAWATLQWQVTNVSQQQASLDAMVREIRTDQEARLRVVERVSTAMSTEILAIHASLARIERLLEERP
jgi:hypothetical protein